MTAALLTTAALRHRYGSLAAVDGVDLRVTDGERHALIGPNGAGKTTLMDLLAGTLRPHGGRIHLAGRDVTRLGPVRRARLGIGRTHQRPAVWPSLSTMDNVVVAAWHSPAPPSPGPRLPADLAVSLEDLPPSSDMFTSATARSARTWGRGSARWRWQRRVAAGLLDRMGLLAEADTPAGHLSHGQRRQLEIAMALAGGSRLLLMDEPAAGLSAPELDRLRAVLAGLPRTVTVLLVEHRLDLVYAFADTVTVLEAGRVVASAHPARIRRSDAVRGAFAEAVR